MKKQATKRQPEKQQQPEPVKNTDERFIDAGTLESGIFVPDDDIRDEFEDAQRLKLARGHKLVRRQIENAPDDPNIAANDPDANIMEASTVGEESVVGGTPTPDQDNVEIIGQAIGLEYQDNEPLHTTEKVTERDRHRWELDPASSEDYSDRVNRK